MSEMLIKLCATTLFSIVLFTLGCSAQQSEEQAMQTLRQMTRDGKLPPESVVADISARFANKKTGALARLLHARIRMDAGDPAGAAALLNSDIFEKKTKLGDHALWLRARALQGAARHDDAVKAVSELIKEHPESIRVRDAMLLRATSSLAAGRAVETPRFLADLAEKNDADALLVTAKAYEAQGSQAEAVRFYRRAYFYAAGTAAAKEAEAKLISMGQSLTPDNGPELLARADRLSEAKAFTDAANAYADVSARFPQVVTPQVQIRRIIALSGANRMSEAQIVFNSLPTAAGQIEPAYRQMALGYAKAKQWPQARSTVDQMKQRFPTSPLVPRTMVDVGMAAREAKYRADDSFYLAGVLASYPDAMETAQAQFELAWSHHESRNVALSSQMLIDHLARYAGKDTTNRGKAGYWAARDSERAGNISDACVLYDAVAYRYGANWYGYLANGRLSNLKNQGQCRSAAQLTPRMQQAVKNLRSVTVAAETSGKSERERVEKGEDLSSIGLYDWAFEELQEAKRTAGNSPKVNLALARHYRLKGDQVNALLSLGRSYPDYAQMFPEEMGREEWDIFYPLTHWSEIKKWAQIRALDPYQVAGVIRQETIFDVDAASHANAYGLMQLLLPTAKSMARKYSSRMPVYASDLYDPSLNIELGTAYMKDQFAKFGRFEYVGIAYNAGPGRVAPWRASLPIEMDEFVESIPFKETRGYVQGIIRNSAQYRRLYDENGNLRPNVGTKPLRGEIDTKPAEQVASEYPEVIIQGRDGE